MLTFPGTSDMTIPLAIEALLRVWYARSDFTFSYAMPISFGSLCSWKVIAAVLSESAFQCFSPREPLYRGSWESFNLSTIQELLHLSYHKGSLR